MSGLNITALPWEVLPPFAPSYSDHGYRRVVEVRRGGVGGETLVVYAKAANMLVEGEGFVFGKDDAKFIVLACNSHDELVAALQEAISVIERIKPPEYGNGTIVRGRAALAKAEAA